MSGTSSRSGFTLIEIMVAILIIGLMAAIVVPRLRTVAPDQKRKDFIAQLNGLVQFAWQRALTSGKVHRIFFDFDKKEIHVESVADKKDGKSEPEYEKVDRAYLKTSMDIPDNLEIVNFFIEHAGDEMRKSGTTDNVWFFIVPDGLTQEVTINFVDYDDMLPNGDARQFGLVLNPFSAQFKLYDTFKQQ